jgi:hypothetical protein
VSFSFAGGVRDLEGARGYIAVGPEIAAVDLGTGAVLWRRQRLGRPVAATASRLVTLDCHGPDYVVRLFDATTGADTGRVANLGMPAWAAEAGTEADAVDIRAAPTATGIELAWRVRRPYRGGAPPPHHVSVEAQRESTGAIVLDPATGEVSTVSTALSSAPQPSSPTLDLGPFAKPSPDVIAFDRVGDRVFALKAQPRSNRSTRIALEARDAHDGSSLWGTSLGEIPVAKPSPQRP